MLADFDLSYRFNPNTAQLAIINTPPMGVVGPKMDFGPNSKANPYKLPENRDTPDSIKFPANRYLEE